MRRRRSASPPSNNTKQKKRSRGRARSGLTPSPERSNNVNQVPFEHIFTSAEDLEKEKEIIQEISSTFHEKALQLFDTPENTRRLSETIEKSYLDNIKSSDFRKDILQVIQKEQEKLKQNILLQTKDTRELVIKAEMDFRDIQNQVVRQEATIKQNEKLIVHLKYDLNRLRGVTNPEDDPEISRLEEEKLKEERLKKAAEEEAKRKKEDQRLMELKKMREQEEAEEEEKQNILMSRKNSRQSVSFSMFGGF